MPGLTNAAAALAFNALPLLFVALGLWNAFEALAFFWLNLIAIGIFAFLRMTVSAVYLSLRGRFFAGLGIAAEAGFFVVHFGFFIILMCFPVGAFLPEDTPKTALTDPLVPLHVVLENIGDFTGITIALIWQAILFLRGFALPGSFRDTAKFRAPVSDAYINLFILFVSGFIGVWLGGLTDERLWGVIALAVVKSVADCFLIHVRKNDGEKPPP